MPQNLNLSQNLETSLEIELSPYLIQQLKILHLPYQDLLNKIKEESEQNVLLEVKENDRLFEYISYLNSKKKIRKEVDFKIAEGLEKIKSRTQSLTEKLLEQLDLEEVKEPHFTIIQKLIAQLDDNGYLKDFQKIEKELISELKIEKETIAQALKILQSFEPEGIAARSLKECLLIQVEAQSFENQELLFLLKKIIQEHLEELGEKKFSAIAKIFGISEKAVEQISDFIKDNLTPYPAAAFGQETQAIIPSFAVEERGNSLIAINLEKKYGPSLQLSESYLKMLKNQNTPSDTLDYLKEKMQRAQALIENIEKRFALNEKVVNYILEKQKEFFLKGSSQLKPLLQKDLAQDFGVHPSTISRSLSNKYIQTAKGTFPLKLFCQRDIKGHTSLYIKKRLSEAVAKENPHAPLTDAEILAILKKEGIQVNRRTINTYRLALNIPIAGERKK